MRLHTRLTSDDIDWALQRAKLNGKIANEVGFCPIVAMNSQTHPRAYEISLSSPDYVPLPEPVNRYGKTQKTRRRARNGGWAATRREWGWFIAEIFDQDPDSRWGTRPRYDGRDSKRWGYFDQADFDEKTNFEFVLEEDGKQSAIVDGPHSLSREQWSPGHP